MATKSAGCLIIRVHTGTDSDETLGDMIMPFCLSNGCKLLRISGLNWRKAYLVTSEMQH